MYECPAGDHSIISCDSDSDLEQMVGELQCNTPGKSLIDNLPVQQVKSRQRFEFVRQNQFWSNLPMLTQSLLKKKEPQAEQELEHSSETEASINESFEEKIQKKSNNNNRIIQWTVDNDDLEYDARCIRSTAQGIEVGGCNFVGQWTFKNNGTTAWPRDIYFNRIRGDDVEYRVIGFELKEEGPFNTENLTVTIDFKLPLNPGCYFVSFGLTYGFDDGLQVGKEVTINLESKESLYDTLSDGQFSLDRFFEIAIADTDAAQNNQLTNINNPYDQIMLEQATAAAKAVEEERKSRPYEQLFNRLSQI